MARPNLKTQRKEEIIDAAMICVAQYGISGLTLGKVAEIAQLARPLIRHNIGNREQLIEAVMERFITSSDEQMIDLTNRLNPRVPLSSLVDQLFDLKSSNTTLMLVAEALIAESANRSQIARLMRDWLAGFVNNLEAFAVTEFPNACKETRRTVVTGITGLYFSVDSMSPIGELEEFTSHSKNAAAILLKHLQ